MLSNTKVEKCFTSDLCHFTLSIMVSMSVMVKFNFGAKIMCLDQFHRNTTGD